MTQVNWAGNHTYRAQQVHRPATVEELQDLVAGAPQIRVLGSRHSFTGVGDSAELVSIAGLPADVVVDRSAGTVTFGAGLTYGALARELEDAGAALHNLGSLPHISVAGAVQTATHGSGSAHGNLATAVAGLELVTSSGELIRSRRGDPGFDGLVVGLGALGAVTRLTLDIEPAYEVRQHVFEDLAWDALYERFGDVMASGYSVSVFTRWGDAAERVWVKSRVDEAPADDRPDLLGAAAATVHHHPVPGMDPVNATPQLGRPGPWWDRLPHFRMGFMPSAGDELQAEYLVPREHAVPAIEAMRARAERIRPHLLVCEIRAIAADRLWMSPQHGRDTVGIHFTWMPRPEAVARVLADVEAALAPFEARPHWGKLFLADATAIASLYGRLPDFAGLVARLDPRGAFRNAWLETHVLGT